MSNRLEMSKVNSILKLRQQGWSLVRIAQEMGIHRETVAKYKRQGSGSETGEGGSKPTQLHTGSESSKPTEVCHWAR
jgi:transposase